MGNRTSQALTVGATTTTDVYARFSGTNRIASVTTNGTLSRSFTYDAAGDILTDAKGGVTTTYTYSNAGRMASLTVGSVGQGPYLYNGFAQLASRTVTANPTKTFHMLYDQSGNLIAEANAATGEILREYFWLGGRPVAVMDSAADHAIYAVHVDHLDRPRMMTDWNGTIVWRADYLPFGEVRTSSGPASLNYRFPGQWFMLETGLHYNWHRWYDASTGRYTQPDPIGMPDGPSRYAYAINSPLMRWDRDGLWTVQFGISVSGDAGPVKGAVGAGFAFDSSGNFGSYSYYGAGAGAGAGTSLGVSVGGSNGDTICDLGGLFINYGGDVGGGPSVGGEGFYGLGQRGQSVVGGGGTLGVGVGAGGFGGPTNTLVQPFFNLWDLF